MFDVIVVGGGVAGLSGAMYLARLRRRVLVVDGGRPANRFSHAAHSFFTRDGVPPAELLAIAREQLARYGTVEIRPGEVTALVAHPDRFEALLSDGDAVSGRKVLLATRLEDRLPARRIERFWGISAFHCRTRRVGAARPADRDLRERRGQAERGEDAHADGRPDAVQQRPGGAGGRRPRRAARQQDPHHQTPIARFGA